MSKKIFVFVFALVVFVPFSFIVKAQTTQDAFITWHANDFYPSDFGGKAVPVNRGTINASVALTNNGKLMDTTTMLVSWYLDGGFFEKGVGLSTVTVPVGKNFGATYSLKASINASEGLIDALTVIPVGQPRVVLDLPDPDPSAKSGDSLTVRSIPYFFNINSLADLLFSWTVNGTSQNNNSSVITMNIGDLGDLSAISIKNSVQTRTNQSGTGEKTIKILH